MGKRVLTAQVENCTGCRMCELACSSEKEGEFIPDKSRIRVVHDGLEGWSRPAICLQCPEPMCMDICPNGAISKEKTKAGDFFIAVDRNKCIACHHCVVACPFGAMNFFKNSLATKCDLCGGAPKCVDYCFYDCLHFIELSDEEYDKRSKKIKALTLKACREIYKTEHHNRRFQSSLEASKITSHPSEKDSSDQDSLIRKYRETLP